MKKELIEVTIRALVSLVTLFLITKMCLHFLQLEIEILQGMVIMEIFMVIGVILQ